MRVSIPAPQHLCSSLTRESKRKSEIFYLSLAQCTCIVYYLIMMNATDRAAAVSTFRTNRKVIERLTVDSHYYGKDHRSLIEKMSKENDDLNRQYNIDNRSER